MIETMDGHNIIYNESNLDSKKVVLLCHGITSSKDEGGFYLDLSKFLEKIEFNTFRFDFRGHGESKISSENATIAGMIIDLNTIINYLNDKYDEIYIIAASFGGSILLLLSQQIEFPKVGKVALLNPVINYESTFTSAIVPWGKSFFPQGGMNFLLKKKEIIILEKNFKFNPEMAIEFYYYKPQDTEWNPSIPMVIFHGKKDQIVSIEDSKYFIRKQSSEQIELVELSKSSHGLEEDIDFVYNKLYNFLDE